MTRIKTIIIAAITGIACLAAPALTNPAFASDAKAFNSRGGAASASYGGDWFIADSFSFGVEREMEATGEGAGTLILTLNKNVKTRDALQRLHKSGKEIPSMTLAVPTKNAEGETVYLKYKLERCFIKSWSTSGDADDRPTEEVAFYYNKIAFSYARTKDGKEFDASRPMAWDNVVNKRWD